MVVLTIYKIDSLNIIAVRWILQKIKFLGNWYTMKRSQVNMTRLIEKKNLNKIILKRDIC